ncbi:hypothetical protein ACVBGC_10300 [Burkholderia stagnalis]
MPTHHRRTLPAAMLRERQRCLRAGGGFRLASEARTGRIASGRADDGAMQERHGVNEWERMRTMKQAGCALLLVAAAVGEYAQSTSPPLTRTAVHQERV